MENTSFLSSAELLRDGYQKWGIKEVEYDKPSEFSSQDVKAAKRKMLVEAGKFSIFCLICLVLAAVCLVGRPLGTISKIAVMGWMMVVMALIFLYGTIKALIFPIRMLEVQILDHHVETKVISGTTKNIYYASVACHKHKKVFNIVTSSTDYQSLNDGDTVLAVKSFQGTSIVSK